MAEAGGTTPREKLHRAQPVALAIRPAPEQAMPGEILEKLERYLAFEGGITPKEVSLRFEDLDGGPGESPGLRLLVQVPDFEGPASVVLVAHRACLEVFLPAALRKPDGQPLLLPSPEGASLVPYAVESPLRKIQKVLREEWPEAFTERSELELRVFGRGEGRLPWGRFRPMQLRCLYETLPRLKDVVDCKNTCFDGALTKSLAMVKKEQ